MLYPWADRHPWAVEHAAFCRCVIAHWVVFRLINLCIAIRVFAKAGKYFKQLPFDRHRKEWAALLFVGVVLANPRCMLKYLPWNPKHLRKWDGTASWINVNKRGWMGMPRVWMMAASVASSTADGLIKILLKCMYQFDYVSPVPRGTWFVEYSLALTAFAVGWLVRPPPPIPAVPAHTRLLPAYFAPLPRTSRPLPRALLPPRHATPPTSPPFLTARPSPTPTPQLLVATESLMHCRPEEQPVAEPPHGSRASRASRTERWCGGAPGVHGGASRYSQAAPGRASRYSQGGYRYEPRVWRASQVQAECAAARVVEGTVVGGTVVATPVAAAAPAPAGGRRVEIRL